MSITRVHELEIRYARHLPIISTSAPDTYCYDRRKENPLVLVPLCAGIVRSKDR